MLTATGVDASAPDWALAGEEAFAQAGVQRVDLRVTVAGRALFGQYGFRVPGGATMAWTGGGVSRP